MRQVIALARLCGWLVYHPFDSRYSTPGFPDLTMVKPSCGNKPARLVLAELKSDKGKLTPEQAAWLDALRQVQSVETFCWRPCDWDQIVSVLQPDADTAGRDRRVPAIAR
jgi:hypothetical protein